MSWNPQRLTEAMVLCELSNADLGEELGVGWQTVARWREDFNKGKYEPLMEEGLYSREAINNYHNGLNPND